MTKVLIAFSLIIILVIRVGFFYMHIEKPADKKLFQIQHVFLSEPKKTAKSQGFFVDGVYVLVPRFPEYEYGDSVSISGMVQELKANTSTSLASKPLFIVRNPKVTQLPKPWYYPALFFSKAFRTQAKQTFARVLDSQKASLLMGMVFGIKEGMSDEFTTQLTSSGVLHVVAASGSNVALVSSYVLSLFLLRLKRQYAISALFLTLIFYAVLSGLDPSIVRATIMGIIAFSAQLFGRQNFSYLALALTAGIMLAIDPSLLGNVGFQLSFLATIGILTLKPKLDSYVRRFRFSLFTEDLSTTLAAQILTIPVIAYHFQTFAPVSFLSNLLVLWTVPILMLLGAVGALVGIIHPVLATPFLYLSYPLLAYFEFVVRLTAVQPLFVGLPVAVIAAYYIFICAYLVKK